MNKKILVFITTVAFLGNVFAKPSDDIIGSEDGSDSCSCPTQTARICPRVTPMRCEIITPTRTATATVTPTTPVNQCANYAIDVKFLGQGQGGGINSVDPEAPSCLKQFIKDKEKKCQPFHNGDYRGRNGDHFGSCLLVELSGYDARTDWKTFFSGYGDYYHSSSGGRQGFNDYAYGYYYKDKIFFDVDSAGKCSIVDAPGEDVKICDVAKLTWLVSPISLILAGDIEDLQKETGVVNFALSPDKGSYSTWKASKNAPLLVYDQEHKGIINTATQLFGNWTFGGKKEASLQSYPKSVSNRGSSQVAWENGYEALGSLDSNFDGKVSGDELKDLGLWFDENRNAKSEPGEVKTISQVGITALYYKHYEKDPLSQDIIAKVGFEREINGRIISGTSVDWYSLSANTEAELVHKQVSINNLCSINKPAVRSNDSVLVNGDSSIASSRANPDFSGTWTWKTDTKGSESGGVLVFADDTNGGIAGLSMMELSLSSSDKDKVVMLAMLKARTVTDESGNASALVFEYKGKDGSIVESKATLSKDKLTLSGKSVAYILNGSDKRITKAEYQWEAVRTDMK